MMGLPRLQPTKLCIHDGPEIMSFNVVSERFPDKILTQITTPATQFWYQMKAQLTLSICVNFSDEYYHLACVN